MYLTYKYIISTFYCRFPRKRGLAGVFLTVFLHLSAVCGRKLGAKGDVTITERHHQKLKYTEIKNKYKILKICFEF